ncbi:lipopolysaccharide heptosyltransferase I [Campylobacter sp. RM15925]|uniref:lipopolysaccharide heptosyltransferase I n=1 Tax=Campylobacter sp. RM15925 TaxID=1705724 RepID=UPI0014757712|nr:lipopolysaccharide heptosyltransferase I [Campylobacter sp. RM15925]
MNSDFKGSNLSIAIIKLSSLGDIIHASIVLQFIKRNLPDARITWIVDERFSEILKDHPLIDKLVSLPLKKKEFKTSYKILKNLNEFDVIIDLQGLIKSAVVAKILGDETYGFDKNSVKESFASYFYKYKFSIDYEENIIIRNLSLVANALNFSFSKEEILAKEPCFSAIPARPLNETKRILIAPFASEESKCYDKFKEVINSLKDFEIYLCHAGKQELAKAKEIAKDTHAKLLERLSLKEMVDFISGCDLVIGNDSGITHLAWAQNIASITLFGNRPSNRNAFLTPINQTIDTDKKIDARKIDKSDLCIREISPSLVANTAKRLLNA